MALNVGTLVAHLKLDTTQFTAGIATAKAGASGLVSGVTKTLAGLALPIAAIGTAFVAAAGVAISSAADIEKKFNEVFTLIPGQTEEFYNQMTDDAKKFAVDMGATLSDVGSGMYQAISAGVPAEDVFGFLETAQKAAVGGVSDLETSVKGIASVTNAYGSEVLSAGEASDIMFTTVKKGMTTYEELSAYLSQVTPTAAAMGISFQEIGAAFATATAKGSKTSTVATSLRQVIAELGKDGQVANKWFTEISGTTFPDFIKSGGSLGEALNKMSNYADKNNMSILDMFGSVEGANLALQISGQNANDYSNNLLEMSSSAGATQTAFETMEKSFSHRMDKIKAEFEVTIVNLGETLIPYVETILDWWDENGSGILQPLIDGFNIMQTWWSSNGSGILETLITEFQWLADTLKPFIDMYSSFWSGQANLMSDWWAENGEMIIQAATNVYNAIKFAIDGLVTIWTWVWPYLEEILGGFIETILSVITLFAAVLTGDWDAAGNALIDITIGIMDMLFGVIKLGFDTMANGISLVMNAISQFITDVWAGIVQVFEDAINAVIDLINGMISAVNSVSGAVGITFDTISKVDFDTSNFKAATYDIKGYYDIDALQTEMTGALLSLKTTDAVSTETTNGVSTPSSEKSGLTQNITINNPKSSTASETAKEYKKAAITLGTSVSGA